MMFNRFLQVAALLKERPSLCIVIKRKTISGAFLRYLCDKIEELADCPLQVEDDGGVGDVLAAEERLDQLDHPRGQQQVHRGHVAAAPRHWGPALARLLCNQIV